MKLIIKENYKEMEQIQPLEQKEESQTFRDIRDYFEKEIEIKKPEEKITKEF